MIGSLHFYVVTTLVHNVVTTKTQRCDNVATTSYCLLGCPYRWHIPIGGICPHRWDVSVGGMALEVGGSFIYVIVFIL